MLPQCPGWLSGKESAASAGDLASTPGWEDRLEKAMATHSSILAREIPWTEEPGELQSMGSQRAGHDSVTNQTTNSIIQCLLTKSGNFV